MKTETIALSNVDLLAIHYDSLWELCVLGCKQEQNVMLQQYDKIEVLFLILLKYIWQTETNFSKIWWNE